MPTSNRRCSKRFADGVSTEVTTLPEPIPVCHAATKLPDAAYNGALLFDVHFAFQYDPYHFEKFAATKYHTQLLSPPSGTGGISPES